MLYLFVFLKLPIVAACWIIWWAIHQEPDHDESDGGGGKPRPHPAPVLPHAPRRGPHREATPPAPPRIRPAAGADRLPARDHVRPL
jgi:hypothetical protein